MKKLLKFDLIKNLKLGFFFPVILFLIVFLFFNKLIPVVLSIFLFLFFFFVLFFYNLIIKLNKEIKDLRIFLPFILILIFISIISISTPYFKNGPLNKIVFEPIKNYFFSVPQLETPKTDTKENHEAQEEYQKTIVKLERHATFSAFLKSAQKLSFILTPAVLSLLSFILVLIFLSYIKKYSLKEFIKLFYFPLIFLLFSTIIGILLVYTKFDLMKEEMLKIINSAKESLQNNETTFETIKKEILEVSTSIPDSTQIILGIIYWILALIIVISTILILSKILLNMKFAFLEDVFEKEEKEKVIKNLKKTANLEKFVKLSERKDVVITIFYLILLELKNIGFLIKKGETPLEFARRINIKEHDLAEIFKPSVEIFYKAKYSNLEIKEEESFKMKEVILSVRKYRKEIENFKKGKATVVLKN